MLLSLILALATHASWPLDQIVCPAPGRPAQAASSPESTPWVGLDRLSRSPTSVRDVMTFPANSGETWTGLRAGGAHNGQYSVIDTNARVGSVNTYVRYECGYHDTVRDFAIFAYPGIPQGPSSVPPATRSIAWRSERGIALGENFEQVRRVYGAAALQHVNGMEALAYQERRSIPGTHTMGVVRTTFVFRYGFLVGVYRQAGV